MKKLLFVATLAAAFLASAETVTRSDELGANKDSGVASGFWDVSNRVTSTYERSETSAATPSGYDARWYSGFTSGIMTLFRGIPGLTLLFR